MRNARAVLAIVVAGLLVSALSLLSAPQAGACLATSSTGEAGCVADGHPSGGEAGHVTGGEALLCSAVVHEDEEEGEEGEEEKDGDEDEEDPAAERVWDLVMRA